MAHFHTTAQRLRGSNATGVLQQVPPFATQQHMQLRYTAQASSGIKESLRADIALAFSLAPILVEIRPALLLARAAVYVDLANFVQSLEHIAVATNGLKHNVSILQVLVSIGH